MKIDVEAQRDVYLSRLKELYHQIQDWLQQKSLDTQLESILVEEEFVKYKAQRLVIKAKTGDKLAKLKPVGASIIGAEGRVDLVGLYDTTTFLYLCEGGPRLEVSISDIEKRSLPFFKNVEDAGWYWIEDRRLGRARKLNQELFLDLLSEVSDYGG